jgi:hypothetical protein
MALDILASCYQVPSMIAQQETGTNLRWKILVTQHGANYICEQRDGQVSYDLLELYMILYCSDPRIYDVLYWDT